MWGILRAVGRLGSTRVAGWLAPALVCAGLTLAGPGTAAAGASEPIGVHSMLYLNTPYSFMETMFAQAAGMHASAVRLDVAPALIFPSQSGAPDFSGLDEVMTLAQRYHLRVLTDLLTIPPWMAACPDGDAMTRSRCAPASIADYGRMITQIVRHADPVILDWEVWNEPDRGEFFNGTPQDYAQMLRAAHDAIKAVDPQANVVLGAITGTSGLGWLDQVLSTPGADAVHAFDIANLHERGGLDTLGGDVGVVRAALAARGFSGPLWVTEHGYPADPAFQWDPNYRTGADAQAAYLSASVPSLLDAGASEVFVTERDNLTGADASEGLLGGAVTDADFSDPSVVQRPAYAALSRLAVCYEQLGRDCPGPPATASPAALAVPPVAFGAAAEGTVTVSDPGPASLSLGTATVTGSLGAGLSVGQDGCPAVLEPDQTCTVLVHYAPLVAGSTFGLLQIPSDNGSLDVPVSATAASVSALSSAQLPAPAFTASPTGDGVGSPQSLLLELTDGFAAPVHLGGTDVTGPDAARFHLVANRCRGLALAAGQSCGVALVFAPVRVGAAHATLTLHGEGQPLAVALVATAHAPPAIRLLAPVTAPGCAAGGDARLIVLTSEPAAVSWRATRSARAPDPRCRRPAGGRANRSQRTSASGSAQTGSALRARRGRRGYAATLRLGAGLRPGVYELTVTPADAHGLGRVRNAWVTVGP